MGGTWRRAVLTSLQGLIVQLLEVLPVGKFKPPAPPGAAYVHCPSRGRYGSLASGRVKTTLESHHHSRPPCGQLRSSDQCSSAVSHFILLDSTVLTPRVPLIHIPALNSIRVCILENQPATYIRKHSRIRGGFLFENYWLHTFYNIINPPNKIQNCRNNDFLCECGYLWFKIHNLMLSEQSEIKLYINNKRKRLFNMKVPFYRLLKD